MTQIFILYSYIVYIKYSSTTTRTVGSKYYYRSLRNKKIIRTKL